MPLKRKLMHYRTTDDAQNIGAVHTTERIGPRRSFTPEGFLFCEGVPIARVGTMMYGPGEVPVPPGPDGVVYIERDEFTLFAADTMASFNGKPVTNDHPEDEVNPRNWTRLATGTVMNVRRGTEEDRDVLLADLLVTDHTAIQDIMMNKREVSAGYDADYEQTGEGRGRQTHIIGNHVALVERGRCGPRCAIGDHLPHLEGNSMPNKTLQKRTPTAAALAAVRKAFKDAEANALEALNKPEPDGDEAKDEDDSPPPAPKGDGGGDGDNHTHIHIHTGGSDPAAPPVGPPADPLKDAAGAADPMDPNADPLDTGATDGADPMEQRLKAIETTLSQVCATLQKLMGGDTKPAAQAPVGEGDQQRTGDEAGELDPEMQDPDKKGVMTGDSAALATSFQAVLSDAEVLVPGTRMPTFDATSTRKATMDRMCSLRRSVLDHMLTTAHGTKVLTELNSGPVDTQKLTCDAAAVLFKSAAAAQRVINNAAATRDAGVVPKTPDPRKGPQAPRTLAEANAFYTQYWAKK